MLVRPKKRAPKWKADAPKKQAAEAFSFSAPVRGWVLNENGLSATQGGARILDNWIPTLRGVRVRGGCAELVDVTDPVLSLIPYKADVEKLFAATADSIYDCADGLADVSGLSGGEFSHVQFGTAGGSYVYAVNGADDAQLFDGSSWVSVNGASSPAITGVTTASLSQVFSFASRVWFVEAGTMSVWYLPTASIGGAATEYSFASVFKRGGSVLFGAKWSLGAGDGLDDKLVIVTTEGEVAVYAGDDPSSVTTFAKQGVYDIPKPLGNRGYMQAGGDLVIATEGGLIPISAVLTTDKGAIEAKSVSAPIHSYWTERAQAATRTWEVRKSHGMDVMLVSQPGDSTCLVANLLSGAWARITGWDVQCLSEFGGNTYFGTSSGKVYLADSTGTDDGTAYTASYLGLFDGMGAYGHQKTVLQMRALFEAGTPFNAQVGARADYDESLPAPPSAAGVPDGDVWDSGLWDVSVWDANSTTSTIAAWKAAGITGASIAPLVQITSGSVAKPVVELVSIDAQFDRGAVVA